MDWFLDHISTSDLIAIFWAFVLSRFAYEGLKWAWSRFRMESCTQCRFKIRISDPQLQDVVMLSHYEHFHPEKAVAAREKYGEKEEA